MDLTTIEAAITVAKTAAERLEVVAESKLDTKSLAEVKEAQHALANLRQHLFILQEQLRRLPTDCANLLPLVEAKENTSGTSVREKRLRLPKNRQAEVIK